MRKQNLFYELTGINNRIKLMRNSPLGPKTANCLFLNSGHVMEYFLVGPEAKKVVALFFGPLEYVIPSHSNFSTLVSLDDADTAVISHGDMIQLLRNFPESAIHYQEFRRIYQQKVADRIHSLQHMTVPKRFAHLKATQPWVFELVKEEDIANYLGVGGGVLRELLGSNS